MVDDELKNAIRHGNATQIRTLLLETEAPLLTLARPGQPLMRMPPLAYAIETLAGPRALEALIDDGVGDSYYIICGEDPDAQHYDERYVLRRSPLTHALMRGLYPPERRLWCADALNALLAAGADATAAWTDHNALLEEEGSNSSLLLHALVALQDTPADLLQGDMARIVLPLLRHGAHLTTASSSINGVASTLGRAAAFSVAGPRRFVSAFLAELLPHYANDDDRRVLRATTHDGRSLLEMTKPSVAALRNVYAEELERQVDALPDELQARILDHLRRRSPQA